MSFLKGPVGSVAPNARRPFDAGQTFAEDLPTTESGLQTMQQDRPGNPQGPVQRDPMRELRDELTAWRQTGAYVGEVSSDIEVGLGAPPGGAMVRAVQIRVRADLLAGTDYYTIIAKWRDAAGAEQELGNITTESTTITAHVRVWIWSQGSGVRLSDGTELTVSFVATGAPPPITGVQLYADWLVGV